jgi:hydroxyacylglutathione hydrolase
MTIIERIETPGIAHFSYVVGTKGDTQVIVIDPRRDIDVYLQLAEQKGYKIVGVVDTHIHADYISGAAALAAAAKCELSLSAYDRNERYQVKSAHRLLHDGDKIMVGNAYVQVLHTPGHTPEHISLLLHDTQGKPTALFSGDFLFIGSVGRPDLLGEEHRQALARKLYQSIRGKLTTIPDDVQVLPAHGAGSFCGGGIAAKSSSTMQEERRTNPFLKDMSEEQFVKMLLQSLPFRPEYYARVKEQNTQELPTLDLSKSIPPLSADTCKKHLGHGVTFLDVRDPASFSAGHIPGAFCIGLNPQFITYAATVLPGDREIIVVCDDPRQLDEIRRNLTRVGLDKILGYLEGGIKSWQAGGFEVATLPQIMPQDLQLKLAQEKNIAVIDVRMDAEWQAFHVAGAQHVPLIELPTRLKEIPANTKLAIMCAAGYRSTIASSILEHAGYTQLHNVVGGINGWNQAGLPVES